MYSPVTIMLIGVTQTGAVAVMLGSRPVIYPCPRTIIFSVAASPVDPVTGLPTL